MRSSTTSFRSRTSTTKPELREFAESPDAYTVVGPGFRRFLTDRYCLMLGPTRLFTSVQRLRFADVEADVEQIRALAGEHDHAAANWWLGPSTQPPDLHERLLELGAGPPRDHTSELTAMAITRPPEPGPPEVAVRPVESLEEMAVAVRIGWEAFETPPDRRDPDIERRWRDRRASGSTVDFVAFLDGEPVGHALGVYGPLGGLLIGGATLPSVRGRGAYRALVRARWDEAARRGTPALVVHAAPTSEPILRRLGFDEVCGLRRLEDPA